MGETKTKQNTKYETKRNNQKHKTQNRKYNSIEPTEQVYQQ